MENLGNRSDDNRTVLREWNEDEGEALADAGADAAG